MVESTSHFDRRTVLQLTTCSLSSIGAAGWATASTALEVNVGYTAASGRRAALDAATDVVREFAFDALTIQLPEQAVAALERHPGVRYVEKNGTVHALAQTTPWGIDAIDAPEAHACGICGNGADVAIIGTGIDSDHPDLQANVGRGKAFVSCSGLNCNYAWDDDSDHGTHVAGIVGAVDNSQGVVGVAPCATLHALKVLDNSGSGTISDVAAAIEYTADQGWDVANLSLGASSGSQILEDAGEYAWNKGVLLVAAAGNSGPCTDCVNYPAAYDEFMAVSSTNSSDNLSYFSSTGPEVEICAPGSDIYSTVTGGYDTFSGTSMAAPHVSGVGALLMADGYSNANARSRMCNTACPLGLSSNEQGCGQVDAGAAVGCGPIC